MNLPQIGTKVCLARDVDRYPYFVAKAGSTGTVISVSADSEAFLSPRLVVRMDEPITGAEEWDNEVHWYDYDERDDIAADLGI